MKLRKKQNTFQNLRNMSLEIQNDLVWNQNTGELIGFIDLGDIASHILVFLIKSIMNPLSYAFATFATDSIRSFQLFPLFWRSVAILEITCKLKVIAAVSDGASPNRSFYKMHNALSNNISDITYKTCNLFSSDNRDLWFFSDPPHLIKTVRNCLSNSGSYKCTRNMWNNGMDILWSRVVQLSNEDFEDNLRYFPQLTEHHIHLTPYSVMNVRLVAQVLSGTMANIVKKFGPSHAAETAEFILRIDE